MSRSIKILNPKSGTGFTNRKSASSMVHRQRARWTDETQTQIEMLPHAVRSSERKAVHRPYLRIVHDPALGRAAYGPWPGWDARLLSAPGAGA
mgnify:CR=1 FL=1